MRRVWELGFAEVSVQYSYKLTRYHLDVMDLGQIFGDV